MYSVDFYQAMCCLVKLHRPFIIIGDHEEYRKFWRRRVEAERRRLSDEEKEEFNLVRKALVILRELKI